MGFASGIAAKTQIGKQGPKSSVAMRYREEAAKHLLTCKLPAEAVDSGQVSARPTNIPSGVGVAATIKALAIREVIAVLKCILGSFLFW